MKQNARSAIWTAEQRTYDSLKQSPDWEQYSKVNDSIMSLAKNHGTYKYMTDDELKTWSYIAAKENAGELKQGAIDDYLSHMDEVLNYRAGQGQTEMVRNTPDILKPLAYGAYAFGSGIDNAVQGGKQLFYENALPTSPMQYASSELVKDTGKVGKYVYQGINTIGNMLPSILVSRFAGALGASGKAAELIGSASMGATAGGNAYTQAVKDGYDKDKALAYSLGVGASEAGLQYLIGGISPLGGHSGDKLLEKIAGIDNSLKRILLSGAVKIGSETTEEELQNYLEPALRTILFGEDYDAPTIDELLETAIVTALSTGALEGPGTVKSNISNPVAVNKPVDVNEVTGQNNNVPIATNGNGLEAYTNQEKTNLLTGAKNRIVSTFNDAVSFVRNALSDKSNIDRGYFGKVPFDVAQTVQQNAGIDLIGYNVIMNGDDVRHIIKKHGDVLAETARSQIAVSAEDIALIPEIIASPDNVYLSPDKDGKGRPVVAFEKQIENKYITMQGVSDGKHSIQTDTIYIKKKNSQNTGHNAVNSPVINAQSVPLQSSSMLDNNIPQSGSVVNADSTTLNAQNVSYDGLGAADRGTLNSRYDELQAQSDEFHPEGAYAARPTDVPVQDFDGRNIPKSASTIYGAQGTPDSSAIQIEKDIADGKISFDTIHDTDSVSKAQPSDAM